MVLLVQARACPSCIPNSSVVYAFLLEKVPVTVPGALSVDDQYASAYRLSQNRYGCFCVLRVRHRNYDCVQCLEVSRVTESVDTRDLFYLICREERVMDQELFLFLLQSLR